MDTWIVESSGRDWQYRLSGDQVVATGPDQRTVMERIEQIARDGSQFVIIGTDGKVLERGFVGQVPDAFEDIPTESRTGRIQEDKGSSRESFGDQIDREGEKWDKLIEWGVPILGAAGSGVLSPIFLDAGDWFGVFLASLSWSGGCAAATYFVVSGKLQGVQAAGAAAASLLGAWLIANIVGFGVLDIGEEISSFGGVPPVFRILLIFSIAAFQTYGIAGTLLSGGIGIWLGHRLSRHFPYA